MSAKLFEGLRLGKKIPDSETYLFKGKYPSINSFITIFDVDG
jgi:hypothetical protein